MTRNSIRNYSLSVVAARGVATMATYGEWIMKSARIGASLGGVAGFFCAAYIMATMDVLSWTGVVDTVESVVVVFIFAVMIGSLCTAIGGLAGLVLGFVTSPLSRVAFGAATRSESSNPSMQPELPLAKAAAPARFFSDRFPISPAVPPLQVPIDVLLLQIENHVRLEQAAAESFIAFPSQARLHSKTTSPFVN